MKSTHQARIFTLEVSDYELQLIEKALYHDDGDNGLDANFALWSSVDDVLFEHHIVCLRNTELA
jgi:hypothetical protein